MLTENGPQYFLSSPIVPHIAVVDWQSITLGRLLGDVAYFLRNYHAALVARIDDYPWPRYWTPIDSARLWVQRHRHRIDVGCNR